MALDITERNEARAKLEQTSAELAHAARISTLGQLAASIAHEVNQPLSAIITYGKSAKRWLSRPEPDAGRSNQLSWSNRLNAAGPADVIARTRTLAKRGLVETARLDLAALIDESLALVEREARQNRIAVRVTNGGGAVPVIDRVQIQQVLVNLAINAIHAMRGIPGRKHELHIDFMVDADKMVRVSVHDTGSGISGDPAHSDLRPFFHDEAQRHGYGTGHLPLDHRGATTAGYTPPIQRRPRRDLISFTLPAAADETRG